MCTHTFSPCGKIDCAWTRFQTLCPSLFLLLALRHLLRELVTWRCEFHFCSQWKNIENIYYLKFWWHIKKHFHVLVKHIENNIATHTFINHGFWVFYVCFPLWWSITYIMWSLWYSMHHIHERLYNIISILQVDIIPWSIYFPLSITKIYILSKKNSYTVKLKSLSI